jgi:CRISPR-associated endonuclease/helicase Cas3
MIKKEYIIAHPSPCLEKITDQTLTEHSLKTQLYMLEKAAKDVYVNIYLKYSNIIKVICILHDLGKGCPAFQKLRLNKLGDSFPHQAQGLWYFMSVVKDWQKHNAITMPIASHHRGLHNNVSWATEIAFERAAERPITKTNEDTNYEICKSEIYQIEPRFDIILKDAIKESEELNKLNKDVIFQIISYFHSCFIDADCLDTEAFCNPEISKCREEEQKDFTWDKAIEKIDKYVENINKNGKKHKLNKLRNRIYKKSGRAGCKKYAFSNLSSPTGIGKTISSLKFSLKNAKKFNKRRIIFVSPFMSIVRQTAKVIRDILDYNVLEDYSAIDLMEKGYSEEQIIKYEKNKDNWGDTKIIVTTYAQFLDSFFSDKNARKRKICNIANSVVVFDETQELPALFLEVTLSQLEIWHDYFGVNYLFLSATLPNYKKFISEDKIGYVDKDYRKLFEEPLIKRVEVKFPKHGKDLVTIDNVYEMLVNAKNKQMMVITNTRRQSHELYEMAKEKIKDGLFILNTYKCNKHIEKDIKEISRRLENKEPCYLISTSIVEAGIDLDFPEGIRYFTSLRAIIQASGRINRHGDIDKGILHVVNLGDGMSLGTLQIEREVTYKLMKKHSWNVDIYSPEINDEFFDLYLGIIKTNYNDKSELIKQLIDKLKYRDIGSGIVEKDFSGYRVVNNDSLAVLIENYDEISKEVAKEIRKTEEGKIDRKIRRKIAPYLVQIEAKRKCFNSKDVEKINDIHIWKGDYDYKTGINSYFFNKE